MISADRALAHLREGNERFASTSRNGYSLAMPVPFDELATGQNPIAAVLGCADSRVPPVAIFDQGFGQLFSVRVAGNVAGPTQIGSLEFAVDSLGVELIVVLGHSRCGAITATLEAIDEPTRDLSPSLASIVDAIRPAIEPHAGIADPATRVAAGVRAHILATVQHLPAASPLLERRVDAGGLRVVGAEYSLESGVVEFLS